MPTATVAKKMIPVALASALSVGLNMAPVQPSAHDDHDDHDRGLGSFLGTPHNASHISKAVASTPAHYTVGANDTLTAIAERYGLTSQTVAALNGLRSTSSVHEGQSLSLKKASPSFESVSHHSLPTKRKASSSSYTVKSGDTVSGIASKHGVSTSSVLKANKLKASSVIYPGQKLTIPGSSSSSGSDSNSGSDSSSHKSSSSSYTVKSGDTVSGIASKHGVSTSSILKANGLTWSSIIYVGQKLTIPGSTSGSAADESHKPAPSDDVTPLTAEMRKNAQIIIDEGRSLGVNDYGLVIALAAAMQESGLKNVDHGDRDSLGLFQQRPSQGWGTKKQVQDPHYAAKAFFVGVSGKTRGLLDISGWKDMSVAEAAQAVQISAYPDAYAKWEASARSWVKELG